MSISLLTVPVLNVYLDKFDRECKKLFSLTTKCYSSFCFEVLVIL